MRGCKRDQEFVFVCYLGFYGEIPVMVFIIHY